MSKIAAIFGATGLVGSNLLNLLRDNPDYIKMLVFNRKSQLYKHDKIEEILVDWKDSEMIKNQLIADEIFCCVGTTIKKAGSKKAFREVDLDIPVKLAKIAENNKVKKLLIVSSVGADAKSKNFYLQTKGIMEEEVLKHNVPNIHFFRPSMLLGKRNEFRAGEEAGKLFMRLLNPLMFGTLKKYKAIPASVVAKAMINVAKNTDAKIIYNSDELWELAE